MSRSIQDNRNIKTVETGNLQIEGHLMKWQDVVIQISNVSMITAAKLPAPRFPVWALFALVGGSFGILFSRQSYGSEAQMMFFAATCLLVLSIVGIVRWLIDCLKTIGHKYLQILLNSGYVYALYVPDQQFLQRVLHVFENIFKDGGKAGNSVQINIANSTITGSTIAGNSATTGRLR